MLDTKQQRLKEKIDALPSALVDKVDDFVDFVRGRHDADPETESVSSLGFLEAEEADFPGSEREPSVSEPEDFEREGKPTEAQPGSVLELTRDLCGSVTDPDGPTDLSTNPRHMENYGKD